MMIQAHNFSKFVRNDTICLQVKMALLGCWSQIGEKIFKPIFSCSHLIPRNLMPFCVFPIEMYFHSKLHVCNIRLGTLRYSPLIMIRTWSAVSKFIFKNNTMYRYTVTNELQPNFAITWQFMGSYFIFIEMPLKEIHVHCS
jgi:hypothetical protein